MSRTFLVLLFLCLGGAAFAQPTCIASAPNTVACQGQATSQQPTDIVLGQQATGPNRSNQTVKFSLQQLTQTSAARTLSGSGGFPYLPANSFLFEQTFLNGTMTGAVVPHNLLAGSDSATNTTSNGEIDYLRVDFATGAGIKGNRVGFTSTVLYGATAANSAGTGIIGGIAAATALANDGGTAGAQANLRGGLQGGNSQVTLQSGATYWTGVSAHEFDVIVATGASAGYKVGAMIVEPNTDAVQGLYDDVALSINNQGNGLNNGGAGWVCGICFGSKWASWPIASTGTIIKAQLNTITSGFNNNQQAAWGVDFSSVTFSGGFLKSTGYSVDGSGNSSAHSLLLPPITAPSSPASGFVLYVDVADGKLKAKSSGGTVTSLANP